MANERLDRHGSPIVRALFEENTAQPNSLGDIVEDHAGDAFSLIRERSATGADSGLSDFTSEMNPSDPSSEWESLDDEFAADQDEDGIGETDITGTAEGIARGFGSHVALDLGKDGFQIEEIPQRAINLMGQPATDEELDDYDDEDSSNGKYDSRELHSLSEPGRFAVSEPVAVSASAQVRDTNPVTSDEDIDSASRER